MRELNLIGEHWKDNLIGLTWDKRLQAAILTKRTREMRLAKAELDLRMLDRGETPHQSSCEGTFLTVLRSKKKPVIEDIGFSTPEDMFMNNYGSWLAGMFMGLNQMKPQSNQFYMVTTGNVNTGFIAHCTYYGSYSYAFNYGTGNGTQFQLGSSTTASTRAMYAIQSAFSSSPEKNPFPTGPGCYAPGSGTVSFSGAISAGGSGTVNEVAWIAQWYQGTAMLARDVLGVGVAFVAGNSLIPTGAISI